MGDFKHSGYMHSLQGSMREENFLKTKNDVLEHFARDHENSKVLITEAYEQLKLDYPNLNIHDLKHLSPNELYNAVFNVTTAGDVEDVKCSAISVFLVENVKIQIYANFIYSLNGGESAVWVSNQQYSYSFHDNFDVTVYLDRSKSLPDVIEIKSKIIKVFQSIKSINRIITPEAYDDSLTPDQVMSWVKTQPNRLDWEIINNGISGSTRENAFGSEYPSKADMLECKRIGQLISDKFKKSVIITLDNIDEWAVIKVKINSSK